MHSILPYIILGYAAVMVAGGFMGWQMTNRRVWFTSALAGAALLSIAYRISRTEPMHGSGVAALVALGVAAFLGLRLRRRGRAVPGRIFSVLSAGVAGLLAWQAFSLR